MPVKASLVQVRAARDGTLAPVEQDVFDVCARIREVSTSLDVEMDTRSGMYRVSEHCADGRKRTVTWLAELTPDVPDYLRRLLKVDYVDEMDRMDRQAERDQDHRLHETIGPIGEKLAHAARKDLGLKGKIFVPRWP